MNRDTFSQCKIGDTVYDTYNKRYGKIIAKVVGSSLEECEIHVENDSDDSFSIFPEDYETYERLGPFLLKD